MKYLDEFRNPVAAKALVENIRRTSTRPWTVMEVCGGQTHSIIRNGIDQLLDGAVEFIHGPGCPVCVTPLEMIDRALAIAARDKGFAGLVAGAQLHELARDYLPRTARNPVAAVAVHPDVVARMTVGLFHADAAEAIPRARAAIAAIAAHEYSHVVADRVAGKRLPDGATLEQIVSSLSGRVSEPGHRAKSHGPQWCRAYAHMVTRAGFLPHHNEWVRRLRGDIEAAGVGSADEMLDALHSELVRYTVDDPLEDVLRTPAPAGFLNLFPQEVTTHGSDS